MCHSTSSSVIFSFKTVHLPSACGDGEWQRAKGPETVGQCVGTVRATVKDRHALAHRTQKNIHRPTGETCRLAAFHTKKLTSVPITSEAGARGSTHKAGEMCLNSLLIGYLGSVYH